MRWSLSLGRVAGIDIRLHLTFFLLIAWIAIAHWIQARTLDAVVAGVAFVLAIFACVTLHEFGHALTARRYGIRTRDVTLLPIGGVARLERMPDKPMQELWVALAGPAVNVVIAAILFVWLTATGGLRPAGELALTGGPFLERLLAVNLFLVAFNLIPAFPMDGGRVLRALLALRLEYTRATQIAASLGQGLAFVFGLIGLLSNPFLLFIAFFVWIGAAQESSLVQMKSALGGIPVRRAMITDFRSLAPRDPLQRAVELILAGAQQDFPVLEGRRVVGVLTRSGLLQALARGGPDLPVESVMERSIQTVEDSEMLETAFQRLQECSCHTLPVTRGGELVGLMTSDNVGEFLMIQAALRPRAA